MNIIESLKELQDSLKKPIGRSQDKPDIRDFRKTRSFYDTMRRKTLLSQVRGSLKDIRAEDPKLRSLIEGFLFLEKEEEIMDCLEPLIRELSRLPQSPRKVGIEMPKGIPVEIAGVIRQDLKEMERCFDADAYRAVTILCGRVLETALHRKYYEVTGNDLLEKSPGIGLGNIIAKMKEKDIPLDPGITQEIHLVNQIRIYSVHVKQEDFYPTRTQTQAMMLYTIDILAKLFGK